MVRIYNIPSCKTALLILPQIIKELFTGIVYLEQHFQTTWEVCVCLFVWLPALPPGILFQQFAVSWTRLRKVDWKIICKGWGLATSMLYRWLSPFSKSMLSLQIPYASCSHPAELFLQFFRFEGFLQGTVLVRFHVRWKEAPAETEDATCHQKNQKTWWQSFLKKNT